MKIRVDAQSGHVGDFTLLQDLSKGNATQERSLGKLIALLMFGMGYEYDEVTITKVGGEET